MAEIYDNSSLLLFRVGPVYCCAPSFPVDSIILPPKLTHTPGSDASRPGIFRYAGNTVASFDLRHQFGVAVEHWQQPGRMVVAGVDAGVTGFWVDEIVEVMQLPKSGWGPLPALLPRGVFSRTLLFKDQIYLYAEFEQLYRIPCSGYLHQYIQHLQTESPQDMACQRQTAMRHRSVAHATTPRNRTQTSSTGDNRPLQGSLQPRPDSATVARSAGSPSEASVARPAPASRQPHTVIQPKKDVSATKRPEARTTTRKSTRDPTLTRAAAPSMRPASARPVAKPAISTSRTEMSATPRQTRSGTQHSAFSITPAEVVPIRSEQRTLSRVTASCLSTSTEHSEMSPPIGELSVVPETESVSILPLSLLVLLAVSAVLGYVGYQHWPGVAEPVSRNSITQPTQPVTAASDIQPPRVTLFADSTDTRPEPEPPMDRSSKKSPLEPAVTTITPAANDPDTSPSRPEYHAEIIEDEQGITLILDEPASSTSLAPTTPVAKTVPAPRPDTPIASSEAGDKQTVSPEQKASRTTPEAPQTPAKATSPVVREIIHIVKKGDTLWHIALRYVNNPYRYPELARLSHIKNPDLIYPGNRVHIIRRQQPPQRASQR